MEFFLIIGLVGLSLTLPSICAPFESAALTRAARVVRVLTLSLIAYFLFSPAFVYLPRVSAAPTSRRVTLGVDGGHVHWLEGTTTRFAYAAGPRWWFSYSPHAGCCDMGLDFIPPLRLARTDERELRWELVRSDGRRLSYATSERGWYLAGHQVVAGGGDVFSSGILNSIERFDATTGTRRPFTPERQSDGILQSLARTDRGLVAVLERTEFKPGPHGKKRDILVREMDLTAKVIRERKYVLDDWARGYAGSGARALHVAFANGRTFLAQVASRESLEGLGKVLVLPDSGDAIDVCSFAYDPYLPLSFAVGPGGRFFNTGQAVFDLNGTTLMALDPPLRNVAWDGSTLVGVRSAPIVGTLLLARHINIRATLTWIRPMDPDSVLRRWGPPGGYPFPTLYESLSRALRERPAWRGGLDDSGLADEIVRVEIPAR